MRKCEIGAAGARGVLFNQLKVITFNEAYYGDMSELKTAKNEDVVRLRRIGTAIWQSR
jgi:hypothetical protein